MVAMINIPNYASILPTFNIMWSIRVRVRCMNPNTVDCSEGSHNDQENIVWIMEDLHFDHLQRHQ